MAMEESVAITRNGRHKYVFMSVKEYARLKKHDREALGIEQLDEQNIRDIAAAQVPPEYAYLDELMDD